ncbi:hypothetical protein GDO81_028033, partial [Engystomops pustulosus]
MMPLIGWIFAITFGVLDSGTSLILNMWILVAGVQNLRTGQRLNPPELIHFVIAVVNIALQGLLVSHCLLFICLPSLLFVKEFYVPAIMITLTLMYLTYWLTAWLCVYYCVTICNINHPFFVWSRKNIPTYLPYLLPFLAVGCFLISFPTIWTTSVTITLQPPVNGTRDPIFIRGTFIFQPFYIQSASFIGCCVPFLLILVSIVTTVSSLSRHVCKMRHKDSGLPRSKDQAHINAMRTMCRFLGFSISFYINEISFFSKSPSSEDPYLVVSWLIFMLFPTAEPLIIITGNPKLRKHFTG